MDEIRRVWQVDLSLVPQMSEQEREKGDGWLAQSRSTQHALGRGRGRPDDSA